MLRNTACVTNFAETPLTYIWNLFSGDEEDCIYLKYAFILVLIKRSDPTDLNNY